MTALTQQQREAEWVEKAARAIMIARDHGGCIVVDWQQEALDNPHVAQALRQAQAALAAVLPVIREAVLEPYLSVGDQMANILYNLHQTERIAVRDLGTMKRVQDEWDRLRALAKETGA